MHLKMLSTKCQILHFLKVLTLIDYGLLMPYGDIELSQHWLRYWLGAWWHQAITWTNVDLSSVRSNDIHLEEISQEIPQPPITKISKPVFYLNFLWHPSECPFRTSNTHNSYTISEFFTRPKHDFTRLGRVDGWLGRTLQAGKLSKISLKSPRIHRVNSDMIMASTQQFL